MSPEVTRIKWDRQGSNPIAGLGFAVLESLGTSEVKGDRNSRVGGSKRGNRVVKHHENSSIHIQHKA